MKKEAPLPTSVTTEEFSDNFLINNGIIIANVVTGIYKNVLCLRLYSSIVIFTIFTLYKPESTQERKR